jgi:hypothetical protein
MEFRSVPDPTLTATMGDRTVTAVIRRVTASSEGATGFKTRVVFGAEGRWRIRVDAGSRSFRFPAIDVGGA